MAMRDLSAKQLVRLHADVWARMTRGDGYQQPGYDRPALAATKPTWLALLDEIRAEVRRRQSS